ncbi:hypothetical protein BgiMline_015412, partial [Biomphalaria glabrata]
MSVVGVMLNYSATTHTPTLTFMSSNHHKIVLTPVGANERNYYTPGRSNGNDRRSSKSWLSP